ncbi:MAG: hypothetical protein IT197_00920 [Acidimicrobiia bacterium]|nr:hypothetical protein [Acidimicrobiia bacterium]
MRETQGNARRDVARGEGFPGRPGGGRARERLDPRSERGSIPEWVMLLVMGIGIVMALWAVVQPDIIGIVSDALGKLRG